MRARAHDAHTDDVHTDDARTGEPRTGEPNARLDARLRRLRHAGPPPELRDRTLQEVRRTLEARQASPHRVAVAWRAFGWEATAAAVGLAALLLWPAAGPRPELAERPATRSESLAEALDLGGSLAHYVEIRAAGAEGRSAVTTDSNFLAVRSLETLDKELDRP